MVDHIADLRATTSSAPRPSRTAPVSAPILRAGEAAAFPPDETAHWSLRTRLGVVVGLAVLSWAAIGAGLLLILHR